jgi:hypothetical protein
MIERTLRMAAVAALATIVGAGSAAETPSHPWMLTDGAQLDRLAGQPVDISPWAYAWRADRAAQERPEAYFIPRRLERLDRVYRTAFAALPEPQLKSIHYQMPDLLKPLPPKPEGKLLAGLLWTGKLAEYRVELHWPVDAREIPSPEAVEVRVYPTSYGWFGWTVDKILGKPEVSDDRRTWTYKSEPGAKMDWAYSLRVDAATEMVAVFREEDRTRAGPEPTVPEIRVICPGMGTWRRMDVEIEWVLLSYSARVYEAQTPSVPRKLAEMGCRSH